MLYCTHIILTNQKEKKHTPIKYEHLENDLEGMVSYIDNESTSAMTCYEHLET